MSRDDLKVLTEGYITGVNPSSGYEPNSNLEDGEYTKFPDGSIAQVLGERHSNGGVDLALPQYTQVLSDTKDLKLTKEDVKRIGKVLGLNVSVKNTYSDVLDKYSKKIGYSKILEDQENLFKKAEKEVFAVKDESTRNVNRAFFTKKITELEAQRTEKEKEMSKVFDLLFLSQEAQKGTPIEDVIQIPPTEEEKIQELADSERILSANNQEFTEQEVFKYGGQIDKITTLSKTYNIDARKLFDKLKSEGKLEVFDNGGIKKRTRDEIQALPPSELAKLTREELYEHQLQFYKDNQNWNKDYSGFPYNATPAEINEYWEGVKKNQPATYLLNVKPSEMHLQVDKDGKPDFNKPWKEVYSTPPTLNTIQTYSYTPPQQEKPIIERGEYPGLPPAQLNKYMDEYGGKTPKEVMEDRYRVNLEKQELNKVLIKILPEEDLIEMKKLKLSPTQYLEKYKGITDVNAYVKKTPEFERAGRIPFVVKKRDNIYKGLEIKHQSPNEEAYGDIFSAESALNELYKNFPRAFKTTEISDIVTIENGKVKVKEGVRLNEANEAIGRLQGKIGIYQTNSADYVIKNKDLFDAASVDYANEYLRDETFLDDKSSVRGFDKKLGQFTAGRFSLGINLVTPDELKKLRELGIYSAKDLAEADEDKIKFLSQTTKDRVKEFTKDLPEEIDFSLDTYTINPPVKTGEEPNKGGEPKAVTDFTTDEEVGVKRKYPRRFMTPDFGFIPSSGLTPESMQSISLSRIDPLRVGIEEHLKSAGDARNAMTVATADLPQAQRAAFLAETLNSSMMAESDAITKANQINAQNQANADLKNIELYMKEQDYNNAMRDNYEKRVLRGLDVTEQNFRNSMAFLHNAFLEDLNRQMQLNTLDSMYPDVSIDDYGIAGYYNPDSLYQFRDQLIAEKVMNENKRTPTLPTKTAKKKSSTDDVP